jgi:hypothetical protein
MELVFDLECNEFGCATTENVAKNTCCIHLSFIAEEHHLVHYPILLLGAVCKDQTPKAESKYGLMQLIWLAG